MKNITIILLFFISTLSFSGDIIKLELDNPSPRAGEKIELSFNIDPLKKELENQLTNGISLYNVKSIFNDYNNGFTKDIVFNSPGKYTVGPFKFEINGTTYLSDSIIITVLDKLPFEPGLWIRTSEMNGKNYLIIEQYIENSEKVKKKKNTTTYTTEKKSEFAKLSREAEEFSVKNSSSNSTNKRADESDYSSKSMSFSFSKYEIKLEESLEGEFVFEKKHFENLPKRYKIEGVSIKK